MADRYDLAKDEEKEKPPIQKEEAPIKKPVETWPMDVRLRFCVENSKWRVLVKHKGADDSDEWRTASMQAGARREPYEFENKETAERWCRDKGQGVDRAKLNPTKAQNLPGAI